MDKQIIRREDSSLPFSERDESWEQKTLREMLHVAYQEQRNERLWRNIWRGVGVLMFLSVLSLSIGNHDKAQKKRQMAQAEEHTAVIDLAGQIGGDSTASPVELLRDGMAAAYENKNAKAIVIRANSPGGSPVMSSVAFKEVNRLKRGHPNVPVYVVVEEMCASGCYYIAAAADKIYADPSSLVGSIGVIASDFDATGLMNKLGVKRRQRIAGNNKGMGDPFLPETPEQAAIWQQALNQVHGEFIKAVKAGRGKRLQEANHPDLFSGRIYTGIEGKKVGLIDDFGDVYSVARDVVKAPKLVDYTPQDDDLVRLLSRKLGSEMDSRINGLINKVW